jgi:hypothetical protein
MAMDEAGDAVAIWQRQFVIEAAARYAATGVWEHPVAISAPGDHGSAPVVAIGHGGDMVAGWVVYEPETVPCSMPSGVPCVLILKNKDSIRLAFRPRRGTWQPSVTVAVDESANEPRVALDDAGNATAIWSTNGVAHTAIESSFRPAGGNWQTPVPIEASHEPHVATDVNASLQLAVDATGEATASWDHSGPGATTAIKSASRGSTGAWQTPIVVSGGDQHASGVRLAVNASGTATAVWSCQVNPPHYPIFVRAAVRPTASGEWQAPVYLAAGEGWQPDVAVSRDSKVVALWDQVGSFAIPAPPAGIYDSQYEPGLAPASAIPQPEACSLTGPPRISHLRMTHRRFRVAHGTTAITAKAPAGSAFVFALSDPAEITVAISRLIPGLRHGRVCAAPVPKLRRAHARACLRRTEEVATLKRSSEPARTSRLGFTGRIGRRALKPGRYVAQVTAHNLAGVSAPGTVIFEIVR